MSIGPISVAIIVTIGSVSSAVLTAHLTVRGRHEELRISYARQDAVEERAARAAAATNGKLDEIHLLVNSNLTAAIQAEYDAVRRELALMREVLELKKIAGHEPSDTARTTIELTEKKLDELDMVLKERKDE